MLVIDDLEGYVDPAQRAVRARHARSSSTSTASTRMAVHLQRARALDRGQAVAAALDARARRRRAASSTSTPTSASTRRSTRCSRRVRDHGLVLNPHITEPMPRDGRKPNEQDILIAGAYNLGFIGIGAGDVHRRAARLVGRAARDRTASSTRRAASSSTSAGSTSCRGWRSRSTCCATPASTSPTGTSRRATVSERDGGWYVKGDVPLRLFHFSGFDPERPHLLSKHQDRIRLGDHPDLRALCDAYAEELLAAGARDVAGWPYTYDTSASGLRSTASRAGSTATSMLDGLRRVAVRRRRRARRFAEAATAPAAVGGELGVTRYLAALYETRGDLQQRLPRPRQPGGRARLPRLGARDRARRGADPGAVAAAAARGLVRAGERRRPSPAPSPRRWRIARRRPPARRQRRRLPQLGARRRRGRAPGRSSALDAVGVPALPVGLEAPRSRQGHELRPRRRLARRLPGQPRLRQRRRAARARRRRSATRSSRAATRSACGGGRSRVFPERWHGAFEHVDEVWAGIAASSPTRSPRSRRCRWSTCRCPSRCRRCAAPDRAALGPARGLPLPVRLRLQQRVRAQEPARAARRVPARVPGPGEGAALVLKSDQRRAPPGRSTSGCASPPPGIRTCTCSTATSRAEEKNALIAALRLLRVAAPLRGLRHHDRRGDAARQARDRHRLLGQRSTS